MVDDDNKAPRTIPPGANIRTRHSPSLSIIAKSGLATLLLTGTLAVAGYTLSSGISQPHDDVSLSSAQARLEAFRALDPLPLSAVAPDDIDHAIQSMQLSPTAATSLRADLASAASPAPGATPQSLPAAQKAPPQIAPVPVQLQTQRTRLVWITLWDTDVEDGDIVRINSQGYSRTIRLSKKGDTFAIPVPASGVIQVIGVSDGDGGGITVGLASGGAKAIFPIMSEGQVLGLRVKVN